MEQRTYNQYCATARTLDLVGERWTLLLIRELLTGPKRFGDFQTSLRGLGTGLLAARLKHLEGEGLVRKVTLPPPARTPAYALTPAGEDLAPAIMALARWGLTWAMDDRHEAETFHSGWAMLGLEACFQPAAATGLHILYEFRITDEVFHVRIDDGSVQVLQGLAQRPDATISMDSDTFMRLMDPGVTLAVLVKSGAASVDGDPDALRKFPALFRLPARQERTQAAR